MRRALASVLAVLLAAGPVSAAAPRAAAVRAPGATLAAPGRALPAASSLAAQPAAAAASYRARSLAAAPAAASLAASGSPAVHGSPAVAPGSDEGERAEADAFWDASARAAEADPSSLDAVAPGVAAQLVRDRSLPAALARWGRSSPVDSRAGPILGAPLMIELSRRAGADERAAGAHSGVLHTYGYLLSSIDTPFGRKRARWVDGELERGLGLPAGLLGPSPAEGTLLANATYVLGRIAERGRPAAAAALDAALGAAVPAALRELDWEALTVDRLVETVRLDDGRELSLRTDLAALPGLPGRRLLAYSIQLAGEPFARLQTLFPTDESRAAALLAPEGLGEDRPVEANYNAIVPELPAGAKGARSVVRASYKKEASAPSAVPAFALIAMAFAVYGWIIWWIAQPGTMSPAPLDIPEGMHLPNGAHDLTELFWGLGTAFAAKAAARRDARDEKALREDPRLPYESIRAAAEKAVRPGADERAFESALRAARKSLYAKGANAEQARELGKIARALRAGRAPETPSPERLKAEKRAAAAAAKVVARRAKELAALKGWPLSEPEYALRASESARALTALGATPARALEFAQAAKAVPARTFRPDVLGKVEGYAQAPSETEIWDLPIVLHAVRAEPWAAKEARGVRRALKKRGASAGQLALFDKLMRLGPPSERVRWTELADIARELESGADREATFALLRSFGASPRQLETLEALVDARRPAALAALEAARTGAPRHSVPRLWRLVYDAAKDDYELPSMPLIDAKDAAEGAAGAKGGRNSWTDFSITRAYARDALIRRGASRRQLAYFDSLLDAAPVIGGRYNQWSGD